MTDDERAELIERQYAFLAEQEAREAAQQIDANLRTSAEPPIESAQARWEREAAEQDERQARERRALERKQAAMINERKSAPVDWDERIASAIADERSYLMKLLEAAIAELEARAHERVDDAMRPLRVELAELKISNCELRLQNNKLREQLAERSGAGVADLPSSLCGRVN